MQMSFIAWTAAVGGLLTTIALASGLIRRLPLSDFALYLAVGIGIGPAGLQLLHVDFLQDARWLNRLTEVALVVSLFVGGLQLRVPWTARSWRVAARLAFPAMVLSIAGAALAAHLLLGLDLAGALVLGAMLAPTDPVLASVVSVDSASDRDGLRVGLSGEAGLNDGTAMPFLLLGLMLMTQPVTASALAHWAWKELVWGMLGGLALGFGIGWLVGRLSTWLAVKRFEPGPGAVLTLGLIALTYAVAKGLGVSGFLAAFACGIGTRQVELSTVRRSTPAARNELPQPAEALTSGGGRELAAPVRAVGQIVSDSLTFGNVMEHLLAPLMVLLLGVAVSQHWTDLGLVMMLPVFVVVRPLSVWLATIGMGLDWRRRLLIGWLGIRGIGGMNYLAYALLHGLQGHQARLIAGVLISVTTLSVVLHGMSARPLLAWRERRLVAAGRSATSRHEAAGGPDASPTMRR